MHTQVEPSPESLGGDRLAQIARRYLLATRPKFLSASLLAVLVGTSWGWQAAGGLDLLACLLALAAVACAHAAVNVFNDVFDDLNGTDRVNSGRIHPYTGGSRFIQNGVLSLQQMQRWGLLLVLLCGVFGLLLALHAGRGVLAFGVAGLGLGLLYSAPPVHLAARGLGEFAVAAGFGLVTVGGAAWLQTAELHWQVLPLAVAVGCWVTNILVINEVPDAAADAQAGKRTLVVRLGSAGAGALYLVLGLLAFACVALLAAGGGLSPWALVLPTALLLPTLAAARRIAVADNGDTAALRRAIQHTLAIHAAGGLWLTLLVWL